MVKSVETELGSEAGPSGGELEDDSGWRGSQSSVGSLIAGLERLRASVIAD